MNLWDLLTGVPIRYASADLPRDVTGAGYDSHTIRPGQVFVAIHGANADGHDYTAQARQRGAACAVSAHPVEGLPYVLVPDPRRALALMAGNFFRHPDRELSLIGVTGTNGKTSVAWLTAGLLQALGIPTGLMGTNGCRIGDAVLPSRRTTPESWEVQGLLRQMADSGCTHAVMEVSSHALALDRVHGLAYTIAAFTNLSRDHLDFHGAMEDYAAAKAALFRQCRAAAVNRDDPWTERILRDCACPVYDYGLHGGRLLAEDMDLSPTGVRFTAREGEVSCPVSVSIPGLFTVYNALAALSMARLSGISLPDAAGALAKVPAVPGRMEPVSAPGLGCRIFIDFAHTPEALAKALEAPIRQIAANAGIDGSVVLEKVRSAGKNGYGFDAYKEEYCDMIASGIVDPAKVTRSALENAASVSGMVLTTESLVADKPQPPAPAAPAPDMGGMGMY